MPIDYYLGRAEAPSGSVVVIGSAVQKPADAYGVLFMRNAFGGISASINGSSRDGLGCCFSASCGLMHRTEEQLLLLLQ